MEIFECFFLPFNRRSGTSLSDIPREMKKSLTFAHDSKLLFVWIVGTTGVVKAAVELNKLFSMNTITT